MSGKTKKKVEAGIPANQPGYHGVRLKGFPTDLRYAGTARCEPVSPPVMRVLEKRSEGCSSQTVMKMTARMTRASRRFPAVLCRLNHSRINGPIVDGSRPRRRRR